MQNEFLTMLLTTSVPLACSLLTAIVGLIVTALKYKKQKYEIAMLEEQNKALSKDEIEDIRAIIREVRK